MDEILEHYDLRWLVSILDTLVDIGDPARSAAAMNIVQCVNYLNVMASLLQLVGDGVPHSIRATQMRKVPSHDGMISLDVYQGDTMYNMQRRLNKVVVKDELVYDLWEEVKFRLVDDATAPTNWLASLHFEESKKIFYHDDY